MSGPSVVVLGSGAAGLAAALAARRAGAEVVVLEASHAVGGTTALSGGVVWVPGNHFLPERERADDTGAAAEYLAALDPVGTDRTLLDAFATDAARVVSNLAEHAPLRWSPLATWPDYRPEFPGARSGGRSIWPDATALPAAVAARIQSGPHQAPFGATPGAPDGAGRVGGGGARRTADDARAGSDAVVFRGPVRGQVLAGALLAALDDAGVEVRTEARVTALRTCGRHAHVVGVTVGGAALEGRVVIASGGFQYDPALSAAHLGPGPVAPMGVPGCRGDAVRLVRSVGAEFGPMDEAWWMPALHVPEERFEGHEHYRPLHGERAQPGAIMVDGGGRRFVNEAGNYGDVGGELRAAAGRCWLVFGSRYRQHYPVGPLRPGDPDPNWLVRADDIRTLAGVLGVPADVLATTVARFDAAAGHGDDPEFGRGTHHYDRWIGDPTATHPTLAPVGDAPYYALAVHLGCLGTKGGPRTDDRGRVMTGPGPLPGLYAAGNAAATIFGRGTPGGGATLGPALVFGWRAGEAAATDR